MSLQEFKLIVAKLEEEGKILFENGRELRKEFKKVRQVFEAEEK